jgi:WhiB family transcriptional regulator, redox-sensing transcriptional regulator
MSTDDFLTDLERACAPGKVDDPDLFFADNHYDRAQAKRTCHGCIRRTDCLTYAVETNQAFGIWGGVLMSDRVEAARARETTPTLPPEHVRAQVNPTREQQKARNEDGVRTYWLQQKSDLEIAMALDITYGAVAHIRRRLGLKALYGPGGRRVQQAVNA